MLSLYVDISSTIETKIKALFAHESQMQEIIRQRKVDLDEIAGWIRSNTKERAKGLEMGYAESFRVITLEPDDEELVKDEG